jgi:hypothetical protein
VPLGHGFQQVIPVAKVVDDAFIEPRRSVADKGAGCLHLQMLMGFNTHFRR